MIPIDALSGQRSIAYRTTRLVGQAPLCLGPQCDKAIFRLTQSASYCIIIPSSSSSSFLFSSALATLLEAALGFFRLL